MAWPYRSIEEKTARFGPASMEVAILSILTGMQQGTGSDREVQSTAAAGGLSGCIVFVSSPSLPVPLNLTRSRRQLSRKLQAPTPGDLLFEFPTAQERHFSRARRVFSSILPYGIIPHYEFILNLDGWVLMYRGRVVGLGCNSIDILILAREKCQLNCTPAAHSFLLWT